MYPVRGSIYIGLNGFLSSGNNGTIPLRIPNRLAIRLSLEEGENTTTLSLYASKRSFLVLSLNRATELVSAIRIASGSKIPEGSNKSTGYCEEGAG